LYCQNNQLTSLDLRNGNNVNSLYYFDATNNPNLSCVDVNNPAWSNINWWMDVDPTVTFSQNCSALGINNSNQSKATMVYPNPTTGDIYFSELGNITLNDLSGKLLLEQKNTKHLDISKLPAGMYFLRVGENNNQLVKVIKE
jgi:hypothetical protein